MKGRLCRVKTEATPFISPLQRFSKSAYTASAVCQSCACKMSTFQFSARGSSSAANEKNEYFSASTAALDEYTDPTELIGSPPSK